MGIAPIAQELQAPVPDCPGLALRSKQNEMATVGFEPTEPGLPRQELAGSTVLQTAALDRALPRRRFVLSTWAKLRPSRLTTALPVF